MNWVSEHLIYFSILLGGVCLVLLVMIILRLSKNIKDIDKRKRRSAVDYMRKTSKHNKNERKKLKF